MKSTFFLSLVACLSPFVSAHGRLRFPKPLGFGTLIPGDNTYNSPLKADGSDFPCKGMIGKANMDPTASWKAGEQAYFEIQPNDAGPGQEGSLAAHSGGSCQVSLSYDNGCNWKVLHSYVGGCPRGAPLNSNIASPNQTFTFSIPAEAKSGKAIFAWSWIARTGNRGEFYMNCASVKIEGYGSSTLTDLPDMWLGEMVTGPIKQGMCQSTAGTNFKYPNPGKAVTVANEDNSTPVGPTNADGSTDFSVCKAPQLGTCQASEQPPAENPPVTTPPAATTTAAAETTSTQPPAETTSTQPPAETTSTQPPVETISTQPLAETTPVGTPYPTTTTALEQPPAKTGTSPSSEYQDITLDGVVYECRKKTAAYRY